MEAELPGDEASILGEALFYFGMSLTRSTPKDGAAMRLSRATWITWWYSSESLKKQVEEGEREREIEN